VALSPSNWIWQCEQPSAKDWHIWLQALQLVFGPQLIITILLDGWLWPLHQPTVHLPYDPASDKLYQPGHHGVWWVFSKLPNALVTNSFTHYNYTSVATLVPATAFHLTLAPSSPAQTLNFQGSCSQSIPFPLATTLATTLSTHVIQLWKEQAWPLHSSVFPNQCLAVTNAIHLGAAQGVCDGSYMSAAIPDFAMTTWLLEDSHFPYQNLYYGITHVSGSPADTNVYCAKLQGLHALLVAIKGLCSFHAITSGSVGVGCDNLGALHQAQQNQELTPCSSAHADLV